MNQQQHTSDETIAQNIQAWRSKKNLSDTSFQDDVTDIFIQMKKDFPGIQTENDAIQMYRWKRKKERAQARRKQ